MSIWKTLSAIDCSEHVEMKGKFSYLSWTWAWAMVKENYPEAQYELLPDTIYQDGTMEVRVGVSIEGLSHDMWLPVLNHQNKPIENPNAFDINTARMRCLVKCLAMFGLGHYIYAGESLPAETVITQNQIDTLTELVVKLSDENEKAFYKWLNSDLDGVGSHAYAGVKKALEAKVSRQYEEEQKATALSLEGENVE